MGSSSCFHFFWVYTAGSCGNYIFKFWGNCILFSKWLCHFIFPQLSTRVIISPISSPTHLLFSFFVSPLFPSFLLAFYLSLFFFFLIVAILLDVRCCRLPFKIYVHLQIHLSPQLWVFSLKGSQWCWGELLEFIHQLHRRLFLFLHLLTPGRALSTTVEHLQWYKFLQFLGPRCSAGLNTHCEPSSTLSFWSCSAFSLQAMDCLSKLLVGPSSSLRVCSSQKATEGSNSRFTHRKETAQK